MDDEKYYLKADHQNDWQRVSKLEWIKGVWPGNHVEFAGPDGYPAGVAPLPSPAGARAMAAAIVRRTDTGFTVSVEVPYKDSMLDAEEAIQQALNEAGVAATEEALRRFDADGEPIRLGADQAHLAWARSARSTRPPTASPPSTATSTRAPRAARPTARSTRTPGSSSARRPGSPR